MTGSWSGASRRLRGLPRSRGGQGLALAITDAPQLADREAAQARLTEWLSDVARSAAGKSLRQLIGEAPRLEALLLGLADGSPYLWDLATADPDRLLTVLTRGTRRASGRAAREIRQGRCCRARTKPRPCSFCGG